MPLYQTYCKECHDRTQVWRKIADRDSLPPCDICGAPLERQIVAPTVRPEIAEYVSPATGKVVSGRVARRDDLLRSGSIEWEPGIKDQIESRRQSLIKEDEVRLDKVVEEVVRDLNASGRLSDAP